MLNASSFRKYNLIAGWAVFIFAAIVYCLTIEPTASFWDCGEYIACSYGLEAGHPPGAPFFMLLAKCISLLTFGHNEYVAASINTLSALASAFTALFLFWSITHLAKKILLKTQEQFTKTNFFLILSAGAVGALSYAFSDSAWFSAEEGEVYALSSLFTAVVFWSMLKWENVADEPRSDRWLIFIAYMIGLSIGVHLLNLLTIPALVFIWYFRKRKVSLKGMLITSVVALAMLGGVQDFIIPGIVKLAGKTELFFVNDLGFRFNSGTIFYFSSIIILLAGGLFLTHRFRIVWMNTVLLSFTVLLIGYSSFFVLVIRAQAGTPINENNPSNSISLLSYLNREQYGDWPLLYGQNFNTPLDPKTPYLDGNPVYVKDEKSGKYIISDARTQTIPNYDKRGCTVFPRMHNDGHASSYPSWCGGIAGDSVTFTDGNGRITAVENIPTLGDNMRFFISYQLSWMYLRYFAWNFIGRQNDYAGGGDDTEGNVLTGISFLDNARLGDQDLLPESQRNNKARNRYFFIPFLLGVIGFAWHIYKAKRDAIVTVLLFVFTGLAIVFYLNQTPGQPRERDYAYVGSFYAYSIWVGLGMIGIFALLRKKLAAVSAVAIAMSFSLLSPVLLLAQNWDDHDRSGRTVAEDIAVNFLNSCEKNAILFTYADNDTFPLWYAQEVLGVRRDIRIICISLFRSDWYIDQAKKKQYTSDPLPISLSHWQYRDGTRDYITISDESNDTMDLRTMVDNFTTKDPDKIYLTGKGDTVNYLPTRSAMLPVDKENFLRQGGYTGSAASIEDSIFWNLRGNYFMKDQIAILDLIAHNNWKRPVYFAINMPVNAYAGLDDYLQLEGLAYRMVPVKNKREEKSLRARPQVNLDKTYKLVMSFGYGGLKDPDVYADETTQRMFVSPMRFVCSVLANALAEAERYKEAIAVIKKCTTEIPASQVPPDEAWLDLINAAYYAEDTALAEELSKIAFKEYFATIRWYNSFGPRNLLPNWKKGDKIAGM
ncbi:MAG: DUF2723 domain-containing protein, partial [Bacteroidota bacterium]|nr:DUF2723 domain-containing protein [Bacteroidota bacterium]